MSLPTFTPPVSPSPGLSDRPEVTLHKATFGGGYTQATPAGINHIRRVVALRWDVLTRPQADAILGFLRERAGHLPFAYRVPGETEPTFWTCDEFANAYVTPTYLSIDATFRQHFGATS